MAATTSSLTQRATAGAPSLVTLDPYQSIPIRNKKYARECTEVHLSDQGGEALSEKFEDFESLEVVWFSGNRLSRIVGLETNFRIREVYLQDNRLVSLAGLRSLKFLRVLLVSNNQLRNLDKQLGILTRFAFLKKLDLFDNPVAEEPDYRLRIIYHLPQVDILDRRAVKGPERTTAAEVVPNMDKVSGSRPEVAKKTPPWLKHSATERFCFRIAGQIAAARKQTEELSMSSTFCVSRALGGPPPEARRICENRDRFEGLKTLGKDSPSDGLELDVLAAACAGAAAREEVRIPTFSQSLGRHLAKPAAKMRGDVFSHSFLVPRQHIDDVTGMRMLKVGHEARLTALGGHH